MYRLFVMDVDGTLLNSNHEISSKVLDAVSKSKSLDNAITLASGRSSSWLIDLLKQLDVDMPHISSGGAVIADHRNEVILDYHAFDESKCNTILKIAYEYDIRGISFQNYKSVIADAGNYSYITKFRKFNIFESPDLFKENLRDVVKIDVTGQPDLLLEIDDRIKEIYPGINSAGLGTICIQYNEVGINKGTALKKLSKIVGIPLSEIVTFGDGDNDICMFEQSGFSIAMGNADPATKKAAKLIAPTNDCDGIAWALEKVMLMNKEVENEICHPG